MGRRGGYGNAGYFAQRMTLNAWYGVDQVVSFFEQDDGVEPISKSQAKAVIDSLLKSKCYITKRHADRFMVQLVERLELEPESTSLADLVPESVPTTKEYFQRFLVSSRWEVLTEQKRIALPRRDSRIKVMAGAKDAKSPIVVDGGFYRLVAWSKSITEPGMYNLVLQLATEEQLAELTNDPVYVDLS